MITSQVTEEQLEQSGANCSICGNAFSAANPATIAKLKNETFHNKEVYAAVCSRVPYVNKHSKKDTTLKTLYQSADNRAGFITLMYTDIDKPEPKRCPTCNSEIKEDKKLVNLPAQKAIPIKKK